MPFPFTMDSFFQLSFVVVAVGVVLLLTGVKILYVIYTRRIAEPNGINKRRTIVWTGISRDTQRIYLIKTHPMEWYKCHINRNDSCFS